MAKKISAWKTKGMNRDLSVSAFNPEFAFENRNLRLSTNDGNTLMSWVNERGPSVIELYDEISAESETSVYNIASIAGIPVGTAILNHYLIVFTIKGEEKRVDGEFVIVYTNYIYRIKYGKRKIADTEKKVDVLLIRTLYEGDLKFDINCPLETLSSYESTRVQKVYWTDGINQPRLINISPEIDDTRKTSGLDTQFDFVPELQLQEEVTVKKVLGGGGTFASGVIQYAFTYYNLHGQETNIFYTTPLYYISPRDRGGRPDEKIDNTFNIKIIGVDTNFDYIRIYSIQRTSINGTPICKRIQDIATEGLPTVSEEDLRIVASFIDTGTTGDTVDPTELLYKGGEEITAETIEQKDGTLFLGNIKIKRNSLQDYKSTIQKIKVNPETHTINPLEVSSKDYSYYSQLTSSTNNSTVPCGGFKYNDYYRCGIQFQHKSGKWSDPFYVNERKDIPQTLTPSGNENIITLPGFNATIDSSLVIDLCRKGYRKVRPVVVFPELQDRVSICQGVVCPTLYTEKHKETLKDLRAQSSWFFRTKVSQISAIGEDISAVSPSFGEDGKYLPYTSRLMGEGIPEIGDAYNPEGSAENNIRRVEIWGDYDDKNKFKVDRNFLTFHSPDIEFDATLSLYDFSATEYKKMGAATIASTLADIDIQIETPPISKRGAGFCEYSTVYSGMLGIVSGLFYEDYLVDDDDEIVTWVDQHSPCRFMVHTWHKNGSLNNDMTRPADKGVQSAVLKKKIISNLRYSTSNINAGSFSTFSISPQLFSSDEISILKTSDGIYQGNIDTLIIPDHADGNFFAFGGWKGVSAEEKTIKYAGGEVKTSFGSPVYWKTFSKSEESPEANGFWRYTYSDEIEGLRNNAWIHNDSAIANDYLDLVLKKESVRMKYKSTPHLIFKVSSESSLDWNTENQLPILDIVRSTVDISTLFGGDSEDALRENNWLPCGDPVILKEGESVTVHYTYGDTYYQRWDCLKTYAFTPEDINQVVEIGSFMLETRINIDGRYDRNRGQVNNLNMSPQNFNLMNMVYSQRDNFFTYKIMPEEYYKETTFPNQITWSKTKESGADVDLWTNVTLASTLELDGNKGILNKIIRFNDQLIAFQDTGISQILYNENAQISTTQGVPIEIGNSGKVQGKRYLSDTVGCSNKWSLVQSPMGIYFMDSIGKNIFLFNGQLNNLSTTLGFNTWAKQNIPAITEKWTPMMSNEAFRSFYDKTNQEVLFINNKDCLAYSEKVGAFTSFYSYDSCPFFCSLDDTGIWLNRWWSIPEDSEEENPTLEQEEDYSFGLHQGGEYGNFFGQNKPYSMILVANPEAQADKIFTNLEFRACIDAEGTWSDNKFTPILPFDYLETWNEYQHGVAYLENKNGSGAMQHHLKDKTAALKRKFRIWRCDIPRNNLGVGEGVDVFDYTFDDTFHSLITTNARPNDRMRNPWIYIKLMRNAATEGYLSRVEFHDAIMTYFG